MILRVALGSATVAVVTASGVVLPLLAGSGVHPEIMVLAVSCGSIAFSHVNDPGFWLFKEYFNLSVIEAIKVRTTYTTVLAILGLGGVLARGVGPGRPQPLTPSTVFDSHPPHTKELTTR